MNQRVNKLWVLVPVAALGLLVVLALPHVVSAYHLEAAGRTLDDPVPALWHLQKATKWDPKNAQAYRLLGKVYRSQGEWQSAMQALTRYTELRPGNPLGYIELAETYEAIQADMAAARLADLVDLLPEADVKDQGNGSHEPLADPDPGSLVAEAKYTLAPDHEPRTTLSMPIDSTVAYTLSLPSTPTVLRFGLGKDLDAHGWPEGGATFKVLVNGDLVFSELLDRPMAQQGWHERMIDLSPWAGEEVLLTLAVIGDPEGDPTTSRAGWGKPEIVDARLPAMEALQPEVHLTDAWRQAGLTTEHFVSAAEKALKSEQLEEAQLWYERAIQMEPEGEELYRLIGQSPSGDSLAVAFLESGGQAALEKVTWLRPGDIYANYHLWKLAKQAGDHERATVYEDLLRQFPPEAVDPNDERLLEYTTEVIPQLLDEELWDLDKTLNAVAFLVWKHNQADSIERLLSQLIALYPQESNWKLYLAELYHRRGDLAQAESAYQQVLDATPDHAEAYLRMGIVIEAQANEQTDSHRLREAATWYGDYHEKMPGDILGLQKLAETCTSLEQRGIREPGCQRAAQRIQDDQEGGQATEQPDTKEAGRGSSAAILRSALEARTDDRHILSDLLGVPAEALELGSNLIRNGNFEKEHEGAPHSWRWSPMFSREPFGAAAFSGGLDDLLSFEGQQAARIHGYWIEQEGGQSPARAGFRHVDETGETRQPIVLTEAGPYVFSIYYRTVGIPGRRVTAWLTSEPDVLWPGDQTLPASDGMWHRFLAVGWNATDATATIEPLLRSLSPGIVVFDQVELRQIDLPEGSHLDSQETQTLMIDEESR